MIISINYADDNFREAQKFNTKTAYNKGKVDKVIEYSPNDIDPEFFKKNANILSKKKGGGYWLWKPYIIYKTLEQMKDGDYLFYCDSGAAYINKVKYLIDVLEASRQYIMSYELPLIEEQWTQEETFNHMKCNDDKYRKSNQRLATYMLIKVNESSKNFIKEYLTLCQDEEILIDKFSQENDKLIQHRHDQSIFSLLCKKNNIDPFRDPSQYGIRPWEYLDSGREYRPMKYKNSTYPQVIVSFRKENPERFIIKDKIKYIMTQIGILNEKQFIKKNKIKK